MWTYINGRFVPSDTAVISVNDQGFLYGDGVFETIRAYRGRLFLLNRHLERLLQSCARLGIPVPILEQDWASLLEEVLRANHLQDGLLRITITRGQGEPGKLSCRSRTSTLVILPRSLPTLPPSMKTSGFPLKLVQTRRNAPSAIPADIKSLNMLNNILAKQEAYQAGAYEGLMLTNTGHIAEGATSNIFFMESECLHTPSLACGILPGITREVVLQLAKALHIPVQEGAYSPNQLFTATECFLTNTAIEILPVQRIDGKLLGSGEYPGPATRRLQKAFHEKVRQDLAS